MNRFRCYCCYSLFHGVGVSGLDLFDFLVRTLSPSTLLTGAFLTQQAVCVTSSRQYGPLPGKRSTSLRHASVFHAFRLTVGSAWEPLLHWHSKFFQVLLRCFFFFFGSSTFWRKKRTNKKEKRCVLYLSRRRLYLDCTRCNIEDSSNVEGADHHYKPNNLK
jgi:hypothetical protein